MNWTERGRGVYEGRGKRAWYRIKRRPRTRTTNEWAVWYNGRDFRWTFPTLKEAKKYAEEDDHFATVTRILDRLVELENEEGVGEVLREEGVTPEVFTELDERPGTWGYEWRGKEWHWKLRCWRNHHYTEEVFA